MITRPVAMILAGSMLAFGCGPNYASRLRDVQEEHQRLLAERDANVSFLEGTEAWGTLLKGANGGFAFTWTPADLEKAAAQTLPMRLDAKTFHSQLEGTIIVEKISAIRFAAGNRVSAVASLKGDKIRFTGNVPAMFKAEVVKFQQGVGEGVTVNLEFTVALVNKSLRVFGHANSATLKKNSSANSEGMLVDEINSRVMRSPWLFDVALPEVKATPKHALLTAGQLVVVYGQ